MTTVPSPSERRDWVRLARTEMVGPVTFADLLKRFGGPENALANLSGLFRTREKGAPAIPSREEVEAELDRGEA